MTGWKVPPGRDADPAAGGGILSPEAEDVLNTHDMHSVEGDDDYAYLYDCDGTFLFSVTRGIDARDLATTLRYARVSYEKGKDDGGQQVQYAMRKLLGLEG